MDLAHFQEKKETKKNKLFFTEVGDLTTIFLHLFCTFELFCWPCREAFTAPTANKIEVPSTRILIFFTPDSCGRGLNGLLLKAVLSRSGFGERIHCNDKAALVESILRSRGLEKKEKEVIVTQGEMHGRKTKQEPRATLVEHIELWTFHNLNVWSNGVLQLQALVTH